MIKEAATSKQKESASTRKSNVKSKQNKSSTMTAHHENELTETKKRGRTHSKMPEKKKGLTIRESRSKRTITLNLIKKLNHQICHNQMNMSLLWMVIKKFKWP